MMSRRASLRSIFFAVLLTSTLEDSTSLNDGWHKSGASTPMDMVTLTQKGYIQFLRWDLPVPEVKEFTFCVWVRSDNLTHPHSIFSYSKNEKDRLVRSWISEGGRTMHLEINGMMIFSKPIWIKENQWYHFCQSWESEHGRYGFWTNGRMKLQGQAKKTIKHTIPSGGDVILGQEYTDFNKGLEDGIEGSVFGFNLLLASAFEPIEANYDDFASLKPLPRGSTYLSTPFFARIPTEIMTNNNAARLDHELYRSYVPGNLAWPKQLTPCGAVDCVSSGEPKRLIQRNAPNDDKRPSNSTNLTSADESTEFFKKVSRFRRNGPGFTLKNVPLGLELIRLTYLHCQFGRGSPDIGGSLMLVSWSESPVRVFGGATLKAARNECGNF